MADPHARLIRALIARSGGHAVLDHGTSESWASVTFTGARHLLRFTMPPIASEGFVRGLEEHEFTIPGHIVADIAVTARCETDAATVLEIAALTIEEG
jgi:hypothetical protein